MLFDVIEQLFVFVEPQFQENGDAVPTQVRARAGEGCARRAPTSPPLPLPRPCACASRRLTRCRKCKCWHRAMQQRKLLRCLLRCAQMWAWMLSGLLAADPRDTHLWGRWEGSVLVLSAIAFPEEPK